MKQKEKEKIQTAVAKWQAETTLAEYTRNHLAHITESGKTKAENVLDSLYNIALASERDDHKINAAETLLKIASADQKPSTQINQQFNFGQDEFVLKKGE